uniref:Serine/threonine-protein kinase HAL5 n=1 Tax=Lygus hesperus TaxID=30085 RepID=A0A0A9YNW3_LYGHE
MEHQNRRRRDTGGSKPSKTSASTDIMIPSMATAEHKFNRSTNSTKVAGGLPLSRISSGTATRITSGSGLGREMTAQSLLRDRSLSSSRRVSLQAAELAKLQASVDSKRGLKDKLMRIVNEIANIGDLVR